MVYILKVPAGDSPGIITFTHKERFLFERPSQASSEALAALNESYLFGMHFGWHTPDKVSLIPRIDFLMAAPGTIVLSDDNPTPRLSLSSREFTRSFFRPCENVPKRWDILCISNGARAKRLDQLLVALRGVYDRRPETKSLLIIPMATELDRKWYSELAPDLCSLFSPRERDKISLLLLQRYDGLYPIPADDISYFMQASRMFTLFSDREGESRVIGEALCSGLPIVAKRHLEGGGRDYLNEGNSALFSTTDEAAECFLKLLEAPLRFDADAMAQKIREDHTIPKFVSALKQIFEDKGLVFEGEVFTKNLARKLPSHDMALPRHLCLKMGDDLKSNEALTEFAWQTLGRAPPLAPLQNGTLHRIQKGLSRGLARLVVTRGN